MHARADDLSIKETLFQNGVLHLSEALPSHHLLNARASIDELFKLPEKEALPVEPCAQPEEVRGSLVIERNHLLKEYPGLAKSEIVQACQKIATRLLGRSAFVSFDHAIYKWPGGGMVEWHQDQAYKSSVKSMKSVHFWIPLHDFDECNGCMQYVSGSNSVGLLKHAVRANSGALFLDHDKEWKRNVTVVEGKLGDIIVHLPGTIHSSLPNNSDSIRKAWIIHFSPFGYYEPLLPINIVFNFMSRIKKYLGLERNKSD
ncbi:phytanoyl-CoA dioxygenase family protein [Marinobacter salicampi]|uniref:phytanoyl-CoA dioxygenase family protein n=1 Tax=Marinobacter salicampi TaxID=435907 RepID=UPI00140A3354|nr:phytanoyl-CoA dioxygenase family protein [Marinobacter salicampi]